MSNDHTRAQYWKCALQVNPHAYIKFRGTDHGLSEQEYNEQLLKVCQEEGIKVLGIADHGSVEGVDAIRELMAANDIIVFPGFEIASSEKVHFVCLFDENTNVVALNRYLGLLELLDPKEGVRPTELSAAKLLSKVEDIGGFVYAAHCTSNNGLLKSRLEHVWTNPLLRAAQIPGSVEDLTDIEGGFYRQVFRNCDPAYKRETPIAAINAKDVETPDTLKNPSASCLIKMTKPGFESFKLAFQDPDSRVRLNAELTDKYFSRIESLKVTGGFLDGVSIEFSEHLNTVIGGRGTGKSTLLECIRYALNREPIGKNSRKQHTEIVKENLGESMARIELRVRSSTMSGRTFTVARRYGEDSIVTDEDGKVSRFSPVDLLPEMEVYGQNEIYEIAQDPESQRKLLARFVESGETLYEQGIRESLDSLSENRKALSEAMGKKAATEDELARLPKLIEQVGQYKSLGIDEQLKIVPLLETERLLSKRIVEQELTNLEKAFLNVRDALLDVNFLDDNVLTSLPHAETLRAVRKELEGVAARTVETVERWEADFKKSKAATGALVDTLRSEIQAREEKLEEVFKDLPASEGKSGAQIGTDYQRLLKQIENLKPKEALARERQNVVNSLQTDRRRHLASLSEYRASRASAFQKSLKRLNRKLHGKLRLSVKPEGNRTPIIKFLNDCKLENVGEKRLAWINDLDDFSPVKLAEVIRSGEDALKYSGWGITPTVANAFCKLSNDQVLRLEELELPDVIRIDLNVAHNGEENFRPLDKLSTGQQCTAILHLLLLENTDPLIMDQPEDNLDNAFIAERIVSELRSAKIGRQFVFATHNANIPVFGDAEWIGVFDTYEGQAHMPKDFQGAIDVPNVRDRAASILEGGKAAFNQRKEKYGY